MVEQFPGRRITVGGAIWLREASKSPDSVTSTSFNTVNLLPKDLCFLPRAPSNFVTPLCTTIFLRNKRARHLVPSIPWTCWLWYKKCDSHSKVLDPKFNRNHWQVPTTGHICNDSNVVSFKSYNYGWFYNTSNSMHLWQIYILLSSGSVYLRSIQNLLDRTADTHS